MLHLSTKKCTYCQPVCSLQKFPKLSETVICRAFLCQNKWLFVISGGKWNVNGTILAHWWCKRNDPLTFLQISWIILIVFLSCIILPGSTAKAGGVRQSIIQCSEVFCSVGSDAQHLHCRVYNTRWAQHTKRCAQNRTHLDVIKVR